MHLHMKLPNRSHLGEKLFKCKQVVKGRLSFIVFMSFRSKMYKLRIRFVTLLSLIFKFSVSVIQSPLQMWSLWVFILKHVSLWTWRVKHVIWETRILLKEPHCTVYTVEGFLIFTPQGGAENEKDLGFLD